MWIETGQQQRWQLVWAEFIRQQWRMWIETMCWSACEAFFNNSFASNGECGLKRHLGAVLPLARHKFIRQQWRMWIETDLALAGCLRMMIIHSPAMANVD